MRYVGSKNRLSKELVPIIQSYITDETKGYIEPFVGGANIIDKIECKNKIGSDIHVELIELLKYVQNLDNKLPSIITEEEYIKVKNNRNDYEKWYVGFVGFCSSFGAKFFGGYARNGKNDNSGNWSVGAIKNIEKQRKNLQGIEFKCCSYDKLNTNIKGYVIYCDIPYKSTLKYAVSPFPYDEFYKWAKEMSVNNIVLISEYYMPDEFECIWSKDVKVSIDSNKKQSDTKNDRTEKLFMYKNGIKSLS